MEGQRPVPTWKRRIVAVVVAVVALFLFNVVVDDRHPVQGTLVGIGAALVAIAFERISERRDAQGKPPLIRSPVSEERATQILIGLAVLAAVAICAFAIGAIASS